MEWLKKVLQGPPGSTPKNRHNLSGDFVSAITHYIEPVRDVDANLGIGLLCYIVDGTYEDAPKKLRANLAARQKLGYEILYIEVDAIKERQGRRRAALKAEFQAPMEVWQRLGEVFAAANSGAKTVQNPPGWPDWLTGIIRAIIDTYMSVYGNDHPDKWHISRLEDFIAHAKLPEDALIVPLLDVKYEKVFNSLYYYGQYVPPDAFSGLGAYCSKYGDSIAALLKQPSIDGGKHAIAFLTAIKYSGTPSLNELETIAKETAVLYPPAEEDNEGEDEEDEQVYN